MLESWCEDLAVGQLEKDKGNIPLHIILEASMPHWPHMTQVAWDEIYVLTPAALYQDRTGKDLLENQFESMCAWLDVDFIERQEVYGTLLFGSWPTGWIPQCHQQIQMIYERMR